MKKFILFFLVACLCMSFSACGLIGDIIGGDENDNEMHSANAGLSGIFGGIGKNDKEDKYDELIEMLENEDYESAIMYIVALSEGGSFDFGEENIIISTLPVATEAPEGVSDEVRWTYENIVENLEYYLEYGYFSYYDSIDGCSYSGNEGFDKAYQFLEEYSDYENAKEYLSRIHFAEDVLLGVNRVTCDYLGNVNEYENIEYYKYDEYGRVTVADYDEEDLKYGSWYDTYVYEYGADGNLSSVKICTYEDGDVDTLITPYYENGVLVSEDVRCADGSAFTVVYMYDDLGRLQYWVREEGECIYSGTYSYTEEGYLESELVISSYYDSWSGEYVLDDSFIKVYAYDENGLPIKMAYTKNEDYDNYNSYYWRTSTDNYDFIYEGDRMVGKVVIYGEYTYGYDGSTALPNDVNSEYSYVYGNYYFFE